MKKTKKKKEEDAKEFQYTIYINQKVTREISKDLRLEHMVIFDYIHKICTNRNNQKIADKRIERGGKIYTWVDYTHLVAQLPLLEMRSKTSTSRAIRQLKRCRLIHTIQEKRNVFVRLGSVAAQLFPEGYRPRDKFGRINWDNGKTIDWDEEVGITEDMSEEEKFEARKEYFSR